MYPFDTYPLQGRELIGRLRGDGCRRGYGLDFMRKTGLTQCAFCAEVDFVADYRAWLSMAVDHVVPVSVCIKLGIPDDWREDCSNRALTCAACNGFRNRYEPKLAIPLTWSLNQFFAFRDQVFVERRQIVAEAHAADREQFEQIRNEMLAATFSELAAELFQSYDAEEASPAAFDPN